MVVSSTLVNVTEDAELRLVSLLAEAAPSSLLGDSFQQDCSASISAGDASKLLQTVVKDPGAVAALTLLEKEEAMAAVSILAALLQRVDGQPITQSLADAVVQVAVTESTQETVQRKIMILSILYNMQATVSEKCALLTKMIQLAGAFPEQLLANDTTLGSLLVENPGSSSLVTTTTAPRLVALLDSWQLPVSERRELYRCIASVLDQNDLRKQRFLLLLTESYTKGEPVDEQGVQAAKEAAIGAIRDPVTLFVHQRNLLQQPAVQALQQSDAKLYGLLEIFQQGKISDYKEFCQNHGGEASLLEPWGLQAEDCQRYMRILSVCSLASEHEEIPYSVVAETLQLDSNVDVESWVIAAISSGLLQAKMDQLKEQVMVERCVVRKFDMEQWKALQSRLASWKENVGGILASLKETQAAHAPAVN